MTLVIYEKNTFEVIDVDDDERVKLRRPFSFADPGLWVQRADCEPYPRTGDYLLNKWIPKLDPISRADAVEYLLEITNALLAPRFLKSPKAVGNYNVVWLNEENEMAIGFGMFFPKHPTLTEEQNKRGINFFFFNEFVWVPVMDLITDESKKHVRFIPYNIGTAYSYMLSLIEEEHLTRDEVETIWHRDRKNYGE